MTCDPINFWSKDAVIYVTSAIVAHSEEEAVQKMKERTA